MLEPERVLGEMVSTGLAATELGPAGYLGADAASVIDLVGRFGLQVVGAFVPVVLHDLSCREETLRVAAAAAQLLAATGGGRFVTAIVVGQDWSPRPALDASHWRNIFDGLAMLDDLCATCGLTQVLHPHIGTLVETGADVTRVLEGSAVNWCLDTGHLTIGGMDPVAFAADHADRVAHVHLKDVDSQLARQLRGGHLSLMQAVQAGIFRPLGQGDVAIADVVAQLEWAGYQGWYVLEQDSAIIGELPVPGEGPIADVRASVEYLRTLDVTQQSGPVPAEAR